MPQPGGHHLIVNPVAGRGRAAARVQAVVQHYAALGQPLTVHATTAPKHATTLVAALPQDAVVLVLGGDGTVHEVAAACAGTKRTLGVLPAGSGDDLAFALGIPRHDLAAALSVVSTGHVQAIDCGRVGGELFVNAFGVGFDADVAYGVFHAPPFLRERSAYLYTILATLARLENLPVTVRVDDRQVYAGPALLVAVQNGPRTGGSFLFSPQASVTDGLLDVLVAGPFGRAGTLQILPQVMRGAHLGHPKIRFVRGKRVRLEWSQARPGHLEGELLPPAATFDIRVEPGALRVFAPPAKVQ